MNCKTCNYSLWNNTKGQCPECGTPFKPSDFDFIPGAVRFHCPHCAQQYFGTDSHGHLEPRSFACVTCQQPLDMDSMVLTPEVGVDEEATQAPEVPWTRVNAGFFSRWWNTIFAAMFRPHVLAAGIRPGVGTGTAWWFAIVTNTVVAMGSWGVLLLFILLVFTAIGPGGGGPPIAAMGGALGGLGLVTIVAYPILILIWGGCAHMIMHIGVTRPKHTLRHTYATLCYAAGANFVNIIPCIGTYAALGGIWWMVATAIGLKHSQKVPTSKAVAAAIIPPLVMASTCIAIYMGVVITAMGSARTAMATATASALAASNAVDQSLTSAITTALQSTPTTQFPNHVAELVLTNSLNTSSFTLSGSGTAAGTIPVLGTSLAQVIFLPTLEEKRVQTRLSQLQMPAVYRFGDFIFTYQGVPTAAPVGKDISDLWLVFSSLDPLSPPPTAINPWPFTQPATSTPAPSPTATATVPTTTPARSVHAGLASGAVKTISPETFATELAAQNALRATFGLTPIPLPESLKQWTEPQPPE